MMKITNECVDCGLPCLGATCPNRQVKRFYCDKCGEEAVLYNIDGEELCQDCLIELFPVVEGSD